MISREDIVGAAVELVRVEGYLALTVHRVAAELGIGRATLLRHVESMSALRNAVALGLLRVEGLEADIDPGSVDSWQDGVAAWAVFIHRTCVASEALYRLLLVHPIVDEGPSPLLLERIAELATAQGVDLDNVADVVATCAQIAITLAGRAHAIRHTGPFDYVAERQASLERLTRAAPTAAPLLARLISPSQQSRITRLEETVVTVTHALAAQVEYPGSGRTARARLDRAAPGLPPAG